VRERRPNRTAPRSQQVNDFAATSRYEPTGLGVDRGCILALRAVGKRTEVYLDYGANAALYFERQRRQPELVLSQLDKPRTHTPRRDASLTARASAAQRDGWLTISAAIRGSAASRRGLMAPRRGSESSEPSPESSRS